MNYIWNGAQELLNFIRDSSTTCDWVYSPWFMTYVAAFLVGLFVIDLSFSAYERDCRCCTCHRTNCQQLVTAQDRNRDGGLRAEPRPTSCPLATSQPQLGPSSSHIGTSTPQVDPFESTSQDRTRQSGPSPMYIANAESFTRTESHDDTQRPPRLRHTVPSRYERRTLTPQFQLHPSETTPRTTTSRNHHTGTTSNNLQQPPTTSNNHLEQAQEQLPRRRSLRLLQRTLSSPLT